MTEQNTEQVAEQTEQNNTEGQATEQVSTPDKSENMIPKSRFDQLNEKRKQAEQELQEVADMLIEDIPEDYKDIVPDLSPSQKIKWLKNAQKKGLFSPKAENSPDANTPGPSNTEADFSNMSTYEKLQHGFK